MRNHTAALEKVASAMSSAAEGEVVIAVVDRGEVVVRTVPRSHASAPQPLAERLAIATATLDAAVDEVLAAQRPVTASGPGPLSDKERALLAAGGFQLEAPPPDDDPAARTIVEYGRLVERALTVAEAARLLGVNESRIRQRLLSRPPTLYGIKIDQVWKLPAAQFEGRATLPGLDRLLATLPRDLHPVAVQTWLTTRTCDLPGARPGDPDFSPREWLLAGHDPEIIAALAAQL